MCPVRSGSAAVVAVLAALVLFLQLPGPATCPNKAWRFSALTLEALEGDPPAEAKNKAAGAAAIVPARLPLPRPAGHAGPVPDAAPPHAGPDAAIDSGVTRAPPAA